MSVPSLLSSFLFVFTIYTCCVGASSGSPPILDTLSLIPSTVDTTLAPQTVEVTAIVEDLDGIALVEAQFQIQEGKPLVLVELELNSGNSTHGEWTGSFVVPQWLGDGSIPLTDLTLRDTQDNEIVLDADAIVATGSDPPVVTRTGPEDTTPPALGSFSITPVSVYADASFVQTVEVTANVEDTEVGVAEVWIDVVADSDSDEKHLEMTRSSGDVYSGVYSVDINVDGTRAPDTYVLKIRVKDALDNQAVLDLDQFSTTDDCKTFGNEEDCPSVPCDWCTSSITGCRTSETCPICGNDDLEEGEACESSSGVWQDCCDSSTCQFRPLGYTCRSPINACDVQETCTGSSALCPSDVTLPDETQCAKDSFCEDVSCNALELTLQDPALGPVEGGAQIVIDVSGLLPGDTVVACSFGTTPAADVQRIGQSITCEAPAHGAGAASVSLSFNGQDPVTVGSFYYYDLSLTSFGFGEGLSVVGALSGGTQVEVPVDNPPPEGTSLVPSCRWSPGSTSTTATYSYTEGSLTLFCDTPEPAAASAPATLTLEITLNGDQWEAVPGSLQVADFSIVTITPPLGPRAGGTTVQMTTSGTAPDGTVRCIFGSKEVTGTVSAGIITCTSPSQNTAGDVAIQVTYNKQEHVTAPDQFFYYAATFSSASPLLGPTTGGTVIEITGTGFVVDGEVTPQCRFGVSPPVSATVTSSTELSCVSPAQTAGTVSLKVSFNGQQFPTVTASYVYYTPEEVSGIFPAYGPADGSTSVTLSGSSVGNVGASVFCRFGDASHTTQGTVTAIGTVTCPSPAYDLSTNEVEAVLLEISRNGQQFTTDNTIFRYYPDPQLSEVTPGWAFLWGMRVVQIVGSEFFDTGLVKVTFGGVAASDVTIVDSSHIECIPPSKASSGDVQVEILLNGVQSSPSTVSFPYRSNPSLSSFSPNVAPVGGGTVITLSGSNFPLDAPVSIVFERLADSIPVAGTIQSTSEIVLTAPEQPTMGSWTVRVTLDDTVQQSYAGTLVYFGPFSLSNPLPQSGPKAGNTLFHITVDVLPDWATFQYITCKFGTSVVSTTGIGGGQVEATVPSQVSTGSYDVVCALDGQQFTSNTLSYLYYDPPTLASQTDPVGYFDYGGVTITVRGSGFVDTPDQMRLQIETIGTYDASFVDSETVEFVFSKPYPSFYLESDENHAITLAMNGQDYAASSSTFGIYASPHITEINPTAGPVTGNTAMTITGINFLDIGSTTLCRFGNLAPVPGTRISDTEIRCTAPATDPIDGDPVTVSLAVSVDNGAYFSTFTEGGFTYYDPPSLGGIAPRYGPSTGQTIVTIYGDHFWSQLSGTCLFDTTEALTPISVQAVDTLTCTAPALPSGTTVDITVSFNGQQYSDTSQPFTYYTTPTLSTVNPLYIWADNIPTDLNVTGSGFLDTDEITMRVNGPGSISQGATFLSSPLVTATFSVGLAGTYEVDLALNGQQYTGSPLTLMAYDVPGIWSVTPYDIAASGGTTLTVGGYPFRDTLAGMEAVVMVSFRGRQEDHPPEEWDSLETTISGTFIDSNTIQVVPPQETTSQHSGFFIDVAISLDGVKFSNTASAFVYPTPVDIAFATPAGGLASGGTAVVVRGGNLYKSSSPMCRFGDVPVYASYVTGIIVSVNNVGNPTNATDHLVEVSLDTSDLIAQGCMRSDCGDLRVLDIPDGETEEELNYALMDCNTMTTRIWFTIPFIPPDTDYRVYLRHGFLALDPVEDSDLTPALPFTPTAPLASVFFEPYGEAHHAIQLVCSSSSGTASATPVSLSVSMDGQVWADGVNYLFFESPSPDLIDPEVAAPTASTNAVLSGQDLLPAGWPIEAYSQLVVRLTAVELAKTWKPSASYDGSSVLFAIPATEGDDEVHVTVEMSPNGQQFLPLPSSAGVWYLNPSVSSLGPQSGPVTGGTLITMYGHFRNTRHLACQFACPAAGDPVVDGTPLEAYAPLDFANFTCESPACPGTLFESTVEGTADGQHFSSDSLPFTFYVDPDVTGVTPDWSFLWGSRTVTILGSGFVDTGEITVSFGGSVVVAAFVDASHLRVDQVPTREVAEVVTVEVALNGQQFSLETTEFTYLDNPVVASISPWGGPLTGSTPATVVGSNFVDATSVLVRLFKEGHPEQIRTGTFVSSEQITFTTPEGADTGEWGVEAMLDDTRYTNSKVFVYYNATVLSTNAPLGGPTSGDTDVTITGTFPSTLTEFINFDLIQCRFGSSTSAATVTVVDDQVESVACSSPTTGAPGDVELRVALNGQQFDSSALVFQYYVEPSLSLIEPFAFGFVYGGEDLMLQGSTFIATGDPILVSLSDGETEDVVSGTFESATNISFVLPESTAATARDLRIALNGQQYTSTSVTVTYFAAPVVTGLDMEWGPSTGATLITMNGVGFGIPDTSRIRAKFAYDSQESIVTGTYLADNKITFLSPSWPPLGSKTEDVSVELSLDDRVYTTNGYMFSYYATPVEITSIYPPLGPISGDTDVSLTVYHLEDTGTIFCRFGPPENTVAAEVLDSTHLKCVSPVVATPELVTLQVSLNGQQYADVGAEYTFYDAHVSGLSLEFAPIRGLIPVSILGSGFVNSSLIDVSLVRVSDLEVVSTFSGSMISPTEIEATLPQVPLETDDVNVRVTLNDQQYHEEMSFTFYDPPVIDVISPTSGPDSGDTVVTVNGTFYMTGVTVVRFGGTLEASCTVVSEGTALHCETPSGMALGTQTMELRIDSIFESNSVSFLVYGPFTVDSVLPTHAPASGNTPVDVFGTNLVATREYACQFDGVSTRQALELTHRQPITVTNSHGTPLAQGAVLRITMDTQTLIEEGRMTGSCGDLTVRDADLANELPSFFDPTTCGLSAMELFIRTPPLGASSTTTVNLLYGGLSIVKYRAKGGFVFDDFDAFTFANVGRWTLPQDILYTFASGQLVFSSAIEGKVPMRSVEMFNTSSGPVQVISVGEVDSSASCASALLGLSPSIGFQWPPSGASAGSDEVVASVSCSTMCLRVGVDEECTSCGQSEPLYAQLEVMDGSTVQLRGGSGCPVLTLSNHNLPVLTYLYVGAVRETVTEDIPLRWFGHYELPVPDTSSEAEVPSVTHVRCMTPASDVGSSTILVSPNSQQFNLDGVTLEFYNVPSVTDVSPTNGTIFGGTELQIACPLCSVSDANDMRVRFGTTSDYPEFEVLVQDMDGDGNLIVTTPPILNLAGTAELGDFGQGVYPVQVSLSRGQQYEVIDTVSFAFDPPPSCSLLRDSFDPFIHTYQWETVSNGGRSASCGSVDGEAFVFGGTTGVERLIASKPFDMRFGGILTVQFRWCATPAGSDKVVVEFSTDGGTAWQTWEDVTPWESWTPITLTLPLSARSPATKIRLRQTEASAQWAIDNLEFNTYSELFPDTEMTSLSPRSGPVSGMTSITIEGREIRPNSALVTFFGDEEGRVDTSTDDTSAVLISPKQSSSATVNVTLGSCGGEMGSLPFFYYMDPQITTVIPPTSNLKGGNTVYVLGTHFVETEEERMFLEYTGIGEENVDIALTPVLFDEMLPLNPVATSRRLGEPFGTGPFSYRFQALYTSDDMEQMGIASGDVIVSISLKLYKKPSFGTENFKVMFRSSSLSTLDRFQTASLETIFTASGDLEDTIIDDEWLSLVLDTPIVYDGKSVLLDFSETRSSSSGLAANGTIPDEGILLRYAYKQQSVRWHDDPAESLEDRGVPENRIPAIKFCRSSGCSTRRVYKFTAPSKSKLGKAIPHLALNGQQFVSSSTVDVFYQDVDNTFTVEPPLGPTKESTASLTISGGFHLRGDPIVCFAQSSTQKEYVRATTVDSSTLSLSLPRFDEILTPSAVVMTVSFDGGQKWLLQEKEFVFYPPPYVDSIYPTFTDQYGHKTVTVRGVNFVRLIAETETNERIRVSFGTEVVVGNAISDTEIICENPPRAPGTVEVMISNNANDFHGALTNPKYFQYKPCSTGTAAPSFTVPCQPCIAGEYSDEEGLTACKLCPLGEYQTETGSTQCLECPVFTTTIAAGAAELVDCVCQEGYYSEEPGVECLACPVGATCPGGTERPRAQSGYWEIPGCLDLQNCFMICTPAQACLGGEESTCLHGYMGYACSECEIGFYKMNEFCKKCPETNLLLMFAMLIMFVTLMLCMFYFISRKLSGLATMRIFFSFVQISALFSFFSIPWPSIVIDVMNFLGFLSFSIELLHPECQVQVSYEVKWLFYMAIPVVVLISLIVLIALHKIRQLLWDVWALVIPRWFRCLVAILFIAILIPLGILKFFLKYSRRCFAWLDYRFKLFVRHQWYRKDGSRRSIVRRAIIFALFWPMVFLMYIYDGLEKLSVKMEIEAHKNVDKQIESDFRSFGPFFPLVDFEFLQEIVLRRKEKEALKKAEKHDSSQCLAMGERVNDEGSVLEEEEEEEEREEREEREEGEGGNGESGMEMDKSPRIQATLSDDSPPFDDGDSNGNVQGEDVSGEENGEWDEGRLFVHEIPAEYSSQFVDLPGTPGQLDGRACDDETDLHVHVGEVRLMSEANLPSDEHAKQEDEDEDDEEEGALCAKVELNHDGTVLPYLTKEEREREKKEEEEELRQFRLNLREKWEEYVRNPRPTTKITRKQYDSTGEEITGSQQEYFIVNTFVAFITVSYVVVSSKSLEFFDCSAQPTGKRTLDANPSIECDWNGVWGQRLVYMGLVATFVYVVAIPASLFVVLRKLSKDRRLFTTYGRAAFGFIFQNFYEDSCFWEVVIMLRKASLVLVRAFTNTTPMMQCSLGLLVLSIFILLHLHRFPYLDPRLNMLELFVLGNHFIILFSGLCFLSEDFPSEASRNALGVVVALALIIGFLVVFSTMMMEIVLKWSHFKQTARRKRIMRELTETKQAKTEREQARRALVLEKFKRHERRYTPILVHMRLRRLQEEHVFSDVGLLAVYIWLNSPLTSRGDRMAFERVLGRMLEQGKRKKFLYALNRQKELVSYVARKPNKYIGYLLHTNNPRLAFRIQTSLIQAKRLKFLKDKEERRRRKRVTRLKKIGWA